ncbi:hypothetical protein B7463_g5973, partial [Scytalidium lignicola]
MLLTSSQVSIAITSTIVFLCTTALFLSGYALQQKTVRDIRAAIKPAPRTTHRAYGHLPKKFDPDAAALATENGNIKRDQRGDSEVASSDTKDADIVIIEASKNPEDGNLKGGSGDAVDGNTQETRKLGQKPNSENRRAGEEDLIPEGKKEGQEPMGIVDERFVIPESQLQPDPNKVQPQPKEIETEKPLSRAARRRKIKEELMAIYERDAKAYSPRMCASINMCEHKQEGKHKIYAYPPAQDGDHNMITTLPAFGQVDPLAYRIDMTEPEARFRSDIIRAGYCYGPSSIYSSPPLHEDILAMAQASDSQDLHGHCNCGNIKITIKDGFKDSMGPILCHCLNCQSASGSLGAVYTIFSAENVTLEGEFGVYADTKTDSGIILNRRYCVKCGSPVGAISDNLNLRGKVTHVLTSNP